MHVPKVYLSGQTDRNAGATSFKRVFLISSWRHGKRYLCAWQPWNCSGNLIPVTADSKLYRIARSAILIVVATFRTVVLNGFTTGDIALQCTTFIRLNHRNVSIMHRCIAMPMCLTAMVKGQKNGRLKYEHRQNLALVTGRSRSVHNFL